MKIALIGRFEEGEIIAGPERVSRELFFELNKINPETVFIEYFFSGYADGSIINKLFGKKFIYNNSVIRLGIFPLVVFLIKEKFDVIHIINSQRFILILFLINPLLKVKLSATLHGFIKYEIPKKKFYSKRYFLDVWLESLIINKCQFLVFPSQLLFENFQSQYKISEKRFQIIPNGVSESFGMNRREFPSIENAIKIVFYNGFDANIKKGLSALISLMKHIEEKIQLFVVGQKENIESNYNIQIVYTGLKSQNEMIEFLKDKHFVIKSQSHEPFSIFIVECMFAGVIPIINKNVGVKDFIVNGFNGFFYDALSTTELRKLFEDISNRLYDLEIISQNAQKIHDVLNWNLITQRYYDSFQGLIS